MALVIDQFIVRTDNFAVLIHDEASGETASIDAPDAGAILSRLKNLGWRLSHILVTHHHGDHTAGNLALEQAFGCTIVAPAAEADRIPGVDREVREGDRVGFCGVEAEVIATPGHTAGHVSYHVPGERLAFVGDTLFSLGCGRLFEGDAETMWASLKKLAALPRETSVYCGHEYTAANGAFALTIEPNNLDLQARVEEVRKLRAANLPTLPTTIGQELSTNPFLRADKPRLRKAIGMTEMEPAAVFAEIRARKDRFG
jgi:hydroxyacylglutathione hydrolase